MSKPFKFRYVNEIVGSFVLGIILLVVLLILFAGRAQGWFEPDYDVETEFPAEGAFGLIEGAEVQILQTVAGYVSRIEPTEEGVIRGVLTIQGKFLQYVRTDSEAVVKKKLGIGGDAFVQITRGKSDPLPEDALFIPSRQDNDLLENIESNIEELKAALLPTLNQLRLGLREYTSLGVELNDEEGSLMQILASLKTLVQNAEQGEGVVGKLFSDEATGKQIDQLITEIRQAAEKMNTILQNVEDASAALPGMVSTVDGELEKVPAILSDSHDAIREAERLIAGIQQHWLLKKYIEQPDDIDIVEPENLLILDHLRQTGAGSENGASNDP